MTAAAAVAGERRCHQRTREITVRERQGSGPWLAEVPPMRMPSLVVLAFVLPAVVAGVLDGSTAHAGLLPREPMAALSARRQAIRDERRRETMRLERRA